MTSNTSQLQGAHQCSGEQDGRAGWAGGAPRAPVSGQPDLGNIPRRSHSFQPVATAPLGAVPVLVHPGERGQGGVGREEAHLPPQVIFTSQGHIDTYLYRQLTVWWGQDRTRHRVVEHYVGRLQVQAAILTRLDLLSRSSELARLFGIQLSEVFSRGSQFRVESSMLRLAKPSNYVPVSPTR